MQRPFTISIFLLGILILPACQSAGTAYTSETQKIPPAKSQYSLNEYIVKLALFAVPRGCILTRAYDSQPNDPISSARTSGTFQLWSITENADQRDKSWYAVRFSINQVYGEFYLDADDPNRSICGFRGFEKYLINTGKVKWTSGRQILSTDDIRRLATDPNSPAASQGTSPTSLSDNRAADTPDHHLRMLSTAA